MTRQEIHITTCSSHFWDLYSYHQPTTSGRSKKRLKLIQKKRKSIWLQRLSTLFTPKHVQRNQKECNEKVCIGNIYRSSIKAGSKLTPIFQDYPPNKLIFISDPWANTRRVVAAIVLLLGWSLIALVIYQISLFDYEMANFDPYEILQVSYDATQKEIKKKYREMSLIYHPDKATGNEKLFMKLTKAYDALTDETARYNWEHYGNPDGPQAMQFGIGLPAWIVEEKNSIWVLGVYTLIFMIGLPTAVYYWWSNSIKFSGEQVLLDTTQLYYYFFHKTPHMMLRRVLMVLAASLEFERGHNSEVVERPTDNAEIPQLMKSLPNLGINNKEKPLCFGYSVKARALLFAHLSRIALPLKTLHQDRLVIHY